MAAKDLIAELEDQVQCPVCLEQFRDPRSLPCQHSFCTECLQGLLGTGTHIRCPCCNKNAPIPNGVGKLLVDFKANTLLETISKFQNPEEVSVGAGEAAALDEGGVLDVGAASENVHQNTHTNVAGTCPVCELSLEITNSKKLICGHHVCENCVEFLQPVGGGHLHCPSCSSETLLPTQPSAPPETCCRGSITPPQSSASPDTWSTGSTILPEPSNNPGPSTHQTDRSPEESRLTFHPCCGKNIDINANGITSLFKPVDGTNDGLVLTSRHLQPGELFTVRLDKKMGRRSGSLMLGVTTRSPTESALPSYLHCLTALRQDTWFMRFNQVKSHGIPTKENNKNHLKVGDYAGVQRRRNGSLHFFINGVYQGVAADDVPAAVYGVVELGGVTQQVTILDPYVAESFREESLLTFHPRCGKNIVLDANGITSVFNPVDGNNNGLVLTSRHLKPDELFTVRLDKKVGRWPVSLMLGVTTRSPTESALPSYLTALQHGTWYMIFNQVMHNGLPIKEYEKNLNCLKVGHYVGVQRRENGCLHFYINGEDLGVAAYNVPASVYGVVELCGVPQEVTITDPSEPELLHEEMPPWRQTPSPPPVWEQVVTPPQQAALPPSERTGCCILT